MGYELHITRAQDWTDSEAHPIGQAEWEAYARSDARLIEDGYVDWADTGRTAAFVWTEHSGPSFVWRGGRVIVKGVRSEEEAGNIVQFARGLAASLQGDDGETYSATGQPE